MAQVVLGLGSSHSPQVNMPADSWQLLRQKDETDTRLNYPELLAKASPELAGQLNEDCWRERGQAVERGVATLGERLQQAAPDVVVIFGDDQHEQFLDDNLPMLAIYHGRELQVGQRHERANPTAWKTAEESRWAQTQPVYPAGWQLA